MSGHEAAVRRAFAEQSKWCDRLDGRFTGLLCRLLGERLDRGTAAGRRALDWPGDPAPFADGLPLRFCGGLHGLVRGGGAPSLAALYPPAPSPDEDPLWRAIERALREHGGALLPWLDRAPQTNEVGRSAVLMAGLLVVAERFALPMRLYELGASAGLNLQLDRYGYELGGLRTGDPDSELQLAPEWNGPPPPDAPVRIAGRAGVDLAPARLPDEAERLIAYVWPEQCKRLDQIEAALAIAATEPPPVETGDAADWLDARLAVEPEPGVVRVVLHSIAFQYFDADTQERIRRRIEQAGAAGTDTSPVGWLRYEKEPGEDRISLRLRTWPGEERLLAFAHPHGTRVRWL